MDYEKKYKEALELARVAAFNGHQSLMEGIFPELKESEDEKTRKEIINYLKKNCRLEWAAWLEKQGEQKLTVEMKTPEESLGIDSETYNKIVNECIYGDDKQELAWTEDDKRILDTLISSLINERFAGRLEFLKGIKVSLVIDWLKSLKNKIKKETV